MKFYLNRQNPAQAIDDLNAGLTKLLPTENFDGFVWEGGISAGQEVLIANKFRQETIPTCFMVLFCRGGAQIAAGPTEWTTKRVSLKNHGGANVFARVLFYK